MKKIILVLMVAMLLGGCQVKKENQTNTNNADKKDIFTSIKDAVDKQILLKCEYTDEDGQVITTYIKGRVVRMKGNGEQANVDGLIKDNKFYLWDNQKKEGMVLDITKLAADGSMSMGDKKIKNSDDVINVLEEKKNNCKVSPESSSLLEIPTDVKFTDSFIK